MRKHMETLTGKGKLVADGKEVVIQYRIEVFQEQHEAASFTATSAAPGWKSVEITGEVSKFLDIGATYTLVLKDGRHCQVFVQSMSLPSPVVHLTAMNAAELFEEGATP